MSDFNIRIIGGPTATGLQVLAGDTPIRGVHAIKIDPILPGMPITGTLTVLFESVDITFDGASVEGRSLLTEEDQEQEAIRQDQFPSEEGQKVE